MNQDLSNSTMNLNHLVHLGQEYFTWLNNFLCEPNGWPRFSQAHQAWCDDMIKLWNQEELSSAEVEASGFLKPAKDDKRFKFNEWQSKHYFKFLQQMYLLNAKHIFRFIDENKTSDRKLNRKIDFVTKQFLDALSPSHTIFTNPEVLKATIDTNGENLRNGLQNFLSDMIRSQDIFSIQMTDSSAFELGYHLAATPGEVIFENDLMQLIQYHPTTEMVLEKPILIIPPWINKYYILDLKPDNSLVKWLVDEGYTVFMISWVNPDSLLRNKGFEDYLFEGPLAALEMIEQRIGQMPVDLVGYCLGGTLLSILLGYLKDSHRIASATFLTTLIDFSDTGDIEVFVDEAQVKAIEARMAEKGYLDGRLINQTFSMLRANDLFWNYFVQNYLLGRTPPPFDLLYWNSDATNMPEKMHSYYLRNMYLENNLIQGKLKVNDYSIDLTTVKIPACFISTELDHIAPWKTTYQGALALRGPTTFVLGGAGHIAGVVNPPKNNKYGFRVHPGKLLPNSAEVWFNEATCYEGSWWRYWQSWLKSLSSNQVPKRIVQNGIEPAPGRYVRKKVS
ncbi:MAG: class I poly(R)-hydroxyalkanoic acid synthase [Gammaproteobacteria bacterium]